MNRLFYGDNLDILGRYIAAESVDLIYLDPPFNSQREYNLIFRESSGAVAESQQQAFLDSWDWSQAAATYNELADSGGQMSEIIRALHALFGPSDFLAYLSMMAVRLVALSRVLKPTGSIYLHCDPTASHYLKLLMDAVFGGENFRNEIVWQRTLAKGLMTRALPGNHDVILSYQKTPAGVWLADRMFTPYDHDDLDEKTLGKYSQIDASGRRYQLTSLLNPNPDRPNLKYEFLGVTRVWRWTQNRMQAAYDSGLVVQPKPGAVPRFKRYLDTQRGKPVGDVWTDISPLNSQAKERLGYPTQKPESLLARLILASTNEGDTVLDPFCGCGTTIAAAQRLNRQWIGIDITARAIDIIIGRMTRDFGDTVAKAYGLVQYPYSAQDARRLARENPFHFQRWALEKLGVKPSDIKPGADRGIDGKLYFADGTSGRTKRVVLSVKGGARVTPRDVRELRGVLDRDGFQIGVLVSAERPSAAAHDDLASGVRHYETTDGRLFQRLQSLTVDDIFDGRGVDYPDAARHRIQAAPGAAFVEPDVESPRLDFDGLTSRQLPAITRVPKPRPAKAALEIPQPITVRARSRRGR